MKKINFNLLVVAFSMLFVGAGCSYDVSVGNVEDVMTTKPFNYSDASYGYNFSGELSDDWHEIEASDPSLLVMFAPKVYADQNFHENINVYWASFLPEEVNLSIEDYSASAMLGVDQYPDYKFISKDNVTVDGYPAMAYTYQFTQNDKTVHIQQLIVKTNKEGYIITYKSSPDSPERYQKVFDSFLKTLSF